MNNNPYARGYEDGYDDGYRQGCEPLPLWLTLVAVVVIFALGWFIGIASS